MSIKLKLSTPVKARFIFSDEINIAEKNDSKILTESSMERAIETRKEIISQRDNIFKAYILLIFLIFLFSNGSEINIPGIDISMNEIPGAIGFLLIVSSITMLTLVNSMANEQIYAAAIDQLYKKASADGLINPIFINLIYEPTEIFLRFLHPRFYPIEDDRYQISKTGKIINYISVNGFSMIYIITFFGSQLYLIYLLYSEFESTISSILITVFKLFCILISWSFQISLSYPFEHTIEKNRERIL